MKYRIGVSNAASLRRRCVSFKVVLLDNTEITVKFDRKKVLGKFEPYFLLSYEINFLLVVDGIKLKLTSFENYDLLQKITGHSHAE